MDNAIRVKVGLWQSLGWEKAVEGATLGLGQISGQGRG